MRAVIQRVSEASVQVDGEVVGSCGGGLLLYIAVHRDDSEEAARKLADRVVGLRIFNDADGKLNHSLAQANEASPNRKLGILAISNFTLYGDAAKSRRPSFMASAPFEAGQKLFELFVQTVAIAGVQIETGVYGADMQVHSVNDGPVTLIMDCPTA